MEDALQQYLTIRNFTSNEGFNTISGNLGRETTTPDLVKQYALERKNHESTKRALNKAIKLANILLDEITNNERKRTLPSSQSIVELCVISSELSSTPTQDMREHSPANFHQPPTIRDLIRSSSSRRHELIQRHSTYGNPNSRESLSPHHIMRHRQGSPKKSASKELAELTQLIRKSSRNPLLQNVRTASLKRTVVPDFETPADTRLSYLQQNSATVAENTLSRHVRSVCSRENQRGQQELSGRDGMAASQNPYHQREDSSNIKLERIDFEGAARDLKSFKSIADQSRSLYRELQGQR